MVVYEFITGLGGSPNRLPDLFKVADLAGTGDRYVYNPLDSTYRQVLRSETVRSMGVYMEAKIYGLGKTAH